MTRAQDLTAVGEGLAAGCLSLGVTEVTPERTAVERAFCAAWRAWPYAHRFSSVQASETRNDIVQQVIRRSERCRLSYLAGWHVNGALVPYLRRNWSLEDLEELLEEHTAVPWSGWQRLAELFIDNLASGQYRQQRA
ncbi:hypothetical protein PU560_07750 [Georgenia sp. 10Sc9-8]|uniref:Uncharacterized protein n=1 Tax=Georgenia halotolerans TaxID=3028317 RepID=A0ABT5TWE3_9MICO|nr:hypothetical protein [Georgenia halotolerans]